MLYRNVFCRFFIKKKKDKRWLISSALQSAWPWEYLRCAQLPPYASADLLRLGDMLRGACRAEPMAVVDMPHGGPEQTQASVDKAVVYLYKVSLEIRRFTKHIFSHFVLRNALSTLWSIIEGVHYSRFPLKMAQELL